MKFVKSLPVSLILTLLTVAGTLSGQEHLTPLLVNPALINQPHAKLQSSQKMLLSLPFMEDFSDGKWYPDPQRWSDALVYVNDDYPVRQPSIGVATFDALDASGAVYADATSFPFPADTLTSLPIDLGSYHQFDSVFMSFHYQPAGIGNAPERDDSLILEFWSQAQQDWVHVWADRGRSMDAFVSAKGRHFGVVVLPVDSSLFFSAQFRFRFRNYASITDASLPDWGGNVDMWHIDYIVLNANRTIHDTLIKNDIAFRDYPESLLKNYFSMPWNQYLANAAGEMQYDVAVPYTAYFYNTSSPVNQIYHVNSLTGGTSYNPTPYNFGNMTMPVDTVVIPKPATGFGNFVFAAPSTPYADFEIIAGLSPFSVNEAIKTNDTVRFYQRFYNYYAYDDGSPEAGYGLSASNPNSRLKVALRFDLNVPDTLRAVRMYFNQTKDQANQEFFTLTIWGQTGGEPGDTLYTEENLMPEFVEGLNQYYTYVLKRPVPVSGTFYAGWQQKSGTMLNLGFDRNRDAREKLWFNIGTGWSQSQFPGALMVRPVLGDTAGAVVDVPEPLAGKSIRLYPNPAGEWLTVEVAGNPGGSRDLHRVEFYNVHGQMLLESVTEGRIDLNALPAGLYLVRVFNAQGGALLGSEKIIIRR